jgi:hypothetical protein
MAETGRFRRPAPGGNERRVRLVSGRGSDDKKGLPPVNEMALEGPNGQVMTFGRIQAAGSESPTG